MTLSSIALTCILLSSCNAIRIGDGDTTDDDHRGPQLSPNNTFMFDLNETGFDDGFPPNGQWKGGNVNNNEEGVTESDDELSNNALIEMFGVMFGITMFFVVALCLLKLYLLKHEKDGV